MLGLSRAIVCVYVCVDTEENGLSYGHYYYYEQGDGGDNYGPNSGGRMPGMSYDVRGPPSVDSNGRLEPVRTRLLLLQ